MRAGDGLLSVPGLPGDGIPIQHSTLRLLTPLVAGGDFPKPTTVITEHLTTIRSFQILFLGFLLPLNDNENMEMA